MAMMMTLSKSKTLIKTLTPSLKSISTFSFLNQHPQPQLTSDPPPPPPPPLPPNPATGSPLYTQNWRNPNPNLTNQSLVPLGFLSNPASYQIRNAAQSHDVNSLKNLFANWITLQRWKDVVDVFEVWVKSLDRNGKPNRPDVFLFNLYLRAYLMNGASVGELLDVVGKMEEYVIEPNTASFNLVLKAMHFADEFEAAEKLLQRMLQSPKEAQPDDESYDLVISLLFRQDQIDAALKYIELSLKSGYMLSIKVFTDCVRSCVDKQRLDTLVLVIEKCKAINENKDLCPNWNMCTVLAEVAMQNDHSKLTYLALEFMHKWIARGKVARPAVHLSVDEGLVVSALSTAGRTNSSTLLDASWSILKRSLCDKKNPEPVTYLAKICALASLGNLQRAFSTLNELERVHANSSGEASEDMLSPFTSLHPLVVACTKKGFETLDLVYFQLENLSRADPTYKSIAALNCVILGCANIGDLDRAYQTFEALGSTFGLTANIHSYNALMYAFGKLKKTFEATKVFEHLCSVGVKPNAMSYSLLANAHLVNRDPKAAVSAIESMVEAGFEPSRETLKKIRRRCVRELDYDTDEKVEQLAKEHKISMGGENRRNILFNLEYSTTYT